MLGDAMKTVLPALQHPELVVLCITSLRCGFMYARCPQYQYTRYRVHMTSLRSCSETASVGVHTRRSCWINMLSISDWFPIDRWTPDFQDPQILRDT